MVADESHWTALLLFKLLMIAQVIGYAAVEDIIVSYPHFTFTFLQMVTRPY